MLTIEECVYWLAVVRCDAINGDLWAAAGCAQSAIAKSRVDTLLRLQSQSIGSARAARRLRHEFGDVAARTERQALTVRALCREAIAAIERERGGLGGGREPAPA